MIAQISHYSRRGFSLCKLKQGEKRPTYCGWNTLPLMSSAFGDDDNVGIITGQLSGDLVCVDIDDSQALQQADEFLPHTDMVDGRPGKPRSHWWYRVTDIPPELTSQASGGIGGPKTKHFRRPDGHPILDLLGTGAQAVVPPSLHASGERRVWYCDGEPATVPMKELWAAVCRLAEACGWQRWKGKGLRERVRRARRFIKKAPLARSGQGGHDTTFTVARTLAREFDLPKKLGRRLLDRYNQRLAAAGEEVWSAEELDHKWEDAVSDGAGGRRTHIENPAEPVNDPHRLAREFLAAERWAFWNGAYYHYDGRRYVEVPEREVKALLNAHVKQSFDADYAAKLREYQQGERTTRPPVRLPVKGGLVTNVLQALESIALVRSIVPMPSRLPAGAKADWLALDNGILDLTTGAMHGHTPEWFSTVALPYGYDPAATCDTWLRVLHQNLEGDAERIALLQEFFGYCLIPSTDAQACLVLVGEGGNGKSVLLAGLRALLGDDNVATVALEAFGTRFQMAQTLGKLANICAEVGELDRTAEGTLKAFVSGDCMTFERKGKDPFTAKPTARLVLATNNVPRFSDRSEGVWRRLKLVPFNRRVPEGERVPGMDNAEWWLRKSEVPGMLNWALEGLRRLRANNMQFTQSAACRQALEAHRLESDPCRAFLLEHYVADPKAEPMKVEEVYLNYKKWCEDGGHRMPLSKPRFGREVRRVFRLEESGPHRFAQLGVQRAWRGLARRAA